MFDRKLVRASNILKPVFEELFTIKLLEKWIEWSCSPSVISNSCSQVKQKKYLDSGVYLQNLVSQVTRNSRQLSKVQEYIMTWTITSRTGCRRILGSFIIFCMLQPYGRRDLRNAHSRLNAAPATADLKCMTDLVSRRLSYCTIVQYFTTRFKC